MAIIILEFPISAKVQKKLSLHQIISRVRLKMGIEYEDSCFGFGDECV